MLPVTSVLCSTTQKKMWAPQIIQHLNNRRNVSAEPTMSILAQAFPPMLNFPPPPVFDWCGGRPLPLLLFDEQGGQLGPIADETYLHTLNGRSWVPFLLFPKIKTPNLFKSFISLQLVNSLIIVHSLLWLLHSLVVLSSCRASMESIFYD